MGRGTQLRRNLRLIQLIARQEGVSIGEAAREFNCSPRTIYRDLEQLQEAAFPLYRDEGGDLGGAWKLVDGFRYRHQIPLSHDELCALWLAQSALLSLEGTVFAEGAASALDKLRATLAEPIRKRLERSREWLAADPARRGGAPPGVVATLRAAVEERRTVELLYDSLSGKLSRRLADPYLLWFDPPSGGLYLAAYAHEHEEVRTFLVDRVRQAFATSRTFLAPATWDPKAHLAAAFGGFRGKPRKVRILFRGRAARLVVERRWHASQRLTTRPGRMVELLLEVPLSPALRGWVLSWMPEARVLEPAGLEGQLRRAMEEGLRQGASGAAGVRPKRVDA